MRTLLIVTAAAIATSAILLYLYLRARRATNELRQEVHAAQSELRGLEQRFKPVVDVEREALRIHAELAAQNSAAATEVARTKEESERLRHEYRDAFAHYERLRTEVRSLEESLEDISIGLYRPHFRYSDSEQYKAAISDIRAKEKQIIKSGNAAICGTAWEVGGSKREGERMIKQYQKLVLMAFNAESDAAIANVTWNNYKVMRTRVEKAFDALNKLGTVIHVTLTEQYALLRLEELALVYEAAEKAREEREEQRRLRAEQKEEERVQRELAREREEAEKDEGKYAKALQKARQEFEQALDAEREEMQTRISELEASVAAAHDRKERALAQAQLTKVGHVYIISNLGAFGEQVIKIGLTRRLDPEERVRELGDASVPFPFDLHALVYSEDAPGLEAKLHNKFWEKRVNWANDRKEFFRVSLAEVNAALEELGLSTKLTTVAEAREFRETLAALEQLAGTAGLPRQSVETIPSDPFAGTSVQQTVG